MATYHVDSTAQQLRATGVVEPVMQWVEDPTTGRRRPSDQQDRDEQGVLLWSVEVQHLVEEWGRLSTVVSRVKVSAMTQPAPPAFEVLQFESLRVMVRVQKSSGQLVEAWEAAGIAGAASGRRSSEAA